MSQCIGSTPKIKAKQKKTVEEIKLTSTVKDMSHVQTRSGQQPITKTERERESSKLTNPKQ